MLGFVLRACGVKCHTSWCLDTDPACIPPAAVLEPGLVVATAPSHILPSHLSPHCTFISADVEETWWHSVFERRPIHVACLSPPCQPWSSAGKRSGLQVPDGQVLLTAAKILSRHKVPIVLVEEVAGFKSHPDFVKVMATWTALGYQCVLEKSLQLSEVSSTCRKRLFLVFRFAPSPDVTLPTFVDSSWRPLAPPSVAQLDAFFEHVPPPLMQPCTLSPTVLQQYMAPELCPDHACRQHNSVETFRARPPTEQAECFLAQYHYQHLLPPGHQRARGLLSTLLRTPSGIRFFSAPEIAAQHGAVGMHYIPQDDRAAMRFLGNALSTPQATMILAMTLQCFAGQLPQISPAEAVEKAATLRLTASTTALVPLTSGWLMCNQTGVAEAMLNRSLREDSVAALFALPTPSRKVLLKLRTPALTGLIGILHVPPGVTLPPLLNWLSDDRVSLQDDWAQDQWELILTDPMPTHLQAYSATVRPAARGSFVRILTPNCIYCMIKGRPDSHFQLATIYRDILGAQQLELACLDLHGQRLHKAEDLPSVVLAIPVRDALRPEPLILPLGAIKESLLVEAAHSLVIAVPEAYALDWWVSLPNEIFHCLGIQCRLENFPPPAGEPSLLTFTALTLPMQLTHSAMLEWLRRHFVLAVLRQELRAAAQTATPCVMVEVQVVSTAIWEGCVPAHFSLQDVAHIWAAASDLVGLPTAARVFTGPLPHCPDVTLRELQDMPQHVARRRRAGRILLTIHPELIGGGSKVEAHAAIKAKLAQTCLAHGCDLSEVNRSIGQRMQKTALSKLQQLLRVESAEAQWQQLQDLLQTQGVKAPLGNEAAQRAAKRIQAAARRKQLFRHEVKAADVSLAMDFFRLSDSNPAPVITSLVPNAAGVMLMDHADAVRLLHDLPGKHFPALAVVCIGHQCPQPCTCEGAIQFPVLNKTGEGHLLLKGCYHNVGEAKILPAPRDSEQVAVADITHCTVQAFADEWLEAHQWEALCKNPVKVLSDAFRGMGVEHPLQQPWAKAFKHNHAPATPHSCNMVQFSAKVPTESLLPGHNQAYLTPRDWSGNLLEGWSVIWLAGDRSEVTRIAVATPQQAGLVRSKGRFGIRVADAVFARAPELAGGLTGRGPPRIAGLQWIPDFGASGLSQVAWAAGCFSWAWCLEHCATATSEATQVDDPWQEYLASRPAPSGAVTKASCWRHSFKAA